MSGAGESSSLIDEPKSDLEKNPNKHRKLHVFALAGVIFFTATGGAYGTEPSVSAVGPFWCLLAFLVVPWVWSLPQAMYTAELSTILPMDGGVSVWARVAFSDFWGFQGGVWCWMEGAATLAVFPTLIVDYGQQLFDQKLRGASAYLLKAVIALCLALLNMRGLNVVGYSAGSLTLFVLLPLIVFCVVGFGDVNPNNWLEAPPVETLDWTFFLNMLLWTLSGYDNMGAVSGEIHQPAVTIPMAQFIAVIAGSAAYLIPLAIATGVDNTWRTWDVGQLALSARNVGGDWLFVWLTVGAAVARCSNFMAELCTNSYFLNGMSEQGMLPKVFSWKHPEFDTPVVSILFNYCVVLVLMMLRLDEILQLANVFTSFSFILAVCSLIKMRVLRPIETRDIGAFNIPLSVVPLFLVFCPAFILVFLIIWFDSFFLLVIAFVVMGLVALFFFALVYLRQKGYITFRDPVPPDQIHETWYIA